MLNVIVLFNREHRTGIIEAVEAEVLVLEHIHAAERIVQQVAQ